MMDLRSIVESHRWAWIAISLVLIALVLCASNRGKPDLVGAWAVDLDETADYIIEGDRSASVQHFNGDGAFWRAKVIEKHQRGLRAVGFLDTIFVFHKEGSLWAAVGTDGETVLSSHMADVERIGQWYLKGDTVELRIEQVEGPPSRLHWHLRKGRIEAVVWNEPDFYPVVLRKLR